MVRCPRHAPGSRSHRRIAELRDTAAFNPERLEARQLMATIVWDGDAGDGNFANPLNWAGDIMPGVEDDAIITPGAGPFIELRAGDTVSLKSLVVDWPLAINGTLGASDQATIGDNFFDIGATGRLETNNLTLEASIGAVSNMGEWTIGGTSLIDRRIVSDGALFIAQSATITLGIGLNAALQYGSIDASILTIRDGATITGTGIDVQIRFSDTLSIGALATLDSVGIFGAGTGVTGNVRLNFSEADPATISNSAVRLDYAFITGAGGFVDCAIDTNGRAIFFGQTTVQGGTFDSATFVFTRPPLAAPTQPNSLVIQDASVQVRRKFFGNATVIGGQIQADTVSTSALGEGLVLRNVTMSGPWGVGGTLTASGLRSAGSSMSVGRSGTLVLEGSGTNELGSFSGISYLGGQGGDIEWTDGHVTFTASQLHGSRAAHVYPGSFFRASFTGPGLHELDILGTNPFRVRGNTFVATFADPAGELAVNGPFQVLGTVEVTSGTVRFGEGLVNLQNGRLSSSSAWIVRGTGTLDLPDSLTHNAASILIADDGLAPFLATVTHNTGIITFEGEGDSPTGPTLKLNLRNWGEIRKTGAGVRTLNGFINNLAGGDISVTSGKLVIDAPLFINSGTITIGSDQFMSPRAVFRTTGNYRESEDALLRIIGNADGDLDDLPRFGVVGTMSLAGEVVVSLTTSTPFPQTNSWQLGYSGTRRLGEYRNMLVTAPGVQGSVVYSGQRFLVMLEV